MNNSREAIDNSSSYDSTLLCPAMLCFALCAVQDSHYKPPKKEAYYKEEDHTQGKTGTDMLLSPFVLCCAV